ERTTPTAPPESPPAPPATPGPATPPEAAPATPPEAPPPAAPPPTPQAPDPARLRAVLQTVLQEQSCALLSPEIHADGAILQGPAPRGTAEAIRRQLDRAGIAPNSVSLALQDYRGPYCGLAEVLRPVLAPPESGPQLRLDGHQPLLRGELLRMEITMPPRPAMLELLYVTNDGQVVQLSPVEAQVAAARLRKGDPAPGFPGWTVEEPFGTDLLLVIASDRPLFPATQPTVQTLDEWLPRARAALDMLRRGGGWAAIRPQVVAVAPRP
ncbi:DUF4384 domain-containing protein, partial [Teichococcus deserti]|uniref:DUF4384 domain-containing protein n=1 Tax=Teichococcus deserti TaxID=1817963 RepID=UPI0013F685BF